MEIVKAIHQPLPFPASKDDADVRSSGKESPGNSRGEKERDKDVGGKKKGGKCDARSMSGCLR